MNLAEDLYLGAARLALRKSEETESEVDQAIHLRTAATALRAAIFDPHDELMEGLGASVMAREASRKL